MIYTFTKIFKSLKINKYFYFLFLFIYLFLFSKNSFSAGLVIPSGSTLNINESKIIIAGDITLGGILQTTTGFVSLTGNWLNTGTYTTTSGEVDFILNAGTQTLNSGGTAVGKTFYDLRHSGNGILQLITNTVSITNNFYNTAGTTDANGQNINIEGDWTSVSDAIFADTLNSSTVIFNGIDQQILGTTNAFYNLTKVGSDSLLFDSTGEQFIRGTLTLQGIDEDNLLTLNSTDAVTPTQFKLNLINNGLQSLRYLNVSNGDATNLSLVAVDSIGVGQGNDDFEESPHWVFGTAEFTWQGDIDSDWSDPSNWDLGMVPGVNDTAIIPDVSGSGYIQPSLVANVSIANLSLQADAILNLNSHQLTVNSITSIAQGAELQARGGTLSLTTLSNEGTITLFGYENITITNNDNDSGAFKFIGDSDGINEDFTIPNIGAGTDMDYYDLIIESTVSPDRFATNADLVIGRNLIVTASQLNTFTNSLTTGNSLSGIGSITINGGTLITSNSNVILNGDFIQTSGTFTAPDSSHTFNVTGNFTCDGGIFNNSSGTLTLNGTNQTFSGDGIVLSSLNKTVITADTLTFDSGVAIAPTITGNLTLQGMEENLLLIKSNVDTVPAPIKLQAGATQILNYLNVRDSDATGIGTGGIVLNARNSIEPNGNNTNWDFDGTIITWQGDDVTSPTDWNVPANWDIGIVPNEYDTAVIESVANDPILIMDARVKILTVESGSTLTLNGNNLTVDEELNNNGTIALVGKEEVNIGTLDLDSGTFVYLGNNDEVQDTFTISKLSGSPSQYYNLVIKDSNAVTDLFETEENLTVHNNLNVTSGTLSISTNDTLTVAQTLTVDGGILSSENGNIDANYDVILSDGSLIAPVSDYSFTIARNFDRSGGGTFIHSSGKVAFDTITTSTIIGNTIFYDITSSTAGKQINFSASSNQTIENQINFYGDSSNKLLLRSTINGTKWDITFPNSEQSVQFIDVQDSNANTNNITCFSCAGETQNNNERWIFAMLAIDVPSENRTCDRTPTIIGVSNPNQTISFRDIDDNIVATTTSDDNGNFMVEVDEEHALAAKPNSLTPIIGILVGPTISNLNIVDDPDVNDQPSITTPADSEKIIGATPTISGRGLAGSNFTIKAKDKNNNLLLQDVATGIIDGSGNYSAELSTPLPGGINYLSVVVNGVSSDILDVKLTDPYGVVFNSVNGSPINGAVVTLYRSSDNQIATVADGDLQEGDVNPVTTGEDGFYSFIAAPKDYYFIIDAGGFTYPSVLSTFPDGKHVVTGSKGEIFTVADIVLEIDHPVDPNLNMLRITKDANKSETTIGQIVTYTIQIENRTNNIVDNVVIEDYIPPGFKYVENRVTLDGIPIDNPKGNRPLNFSVGNFNTYQTKKLKYQLVVGSGVSVGNYENVAKAKYITGETISNSASESVKIVLDPLFDLGNIIGKVYFDYNENGIQDAPQFFQMDQETVVEGPVSGIQIVMEDGTTVTTDKEGRFSIPSVTTGRHLLRLDERTLPEGCFLTTDKVIIVDITPGLMVKANFGVSFDHQSFGSDSQEFFINKVNIIKDREKPIPRLNVSLFNNEIVTFDEIPIENAEFRIFTNYASFIDEWKFEIFDLNTNKIIKSVEGNRFNIQNPIYWDGTNDNKEHIRKDRNYAFRVTVIGENERFDQTKQVEIVFRDLETEEDKILYIKEALNRRENYTQWIKQESEKSNYETHNIIINGETIYIDQFSSELRAINVMKGEDFFIEIPVIKKHGLTGHEILKEGITQDSSSSERGRIDFILPKGEYKVVFKEEETNNKVINLLPEGHRTPQKIQQINEDLGIPLSTYVKDLKVGEDYVFFVGMGDVKMGYSFDTSKIESVTKDEKFKDGFWVEGKLAYYLKGKILGKYLITSSYDSERDKKELFKTIDNNKYYPIYGDDSTLNYSATDTQGNLYLLIEWDKSSVIWGNYNVGFDDTEFSKFSRTLYGGKIDFESLSTTKFGEPKTKAVAFRARAQQKSAHNEFLATGGSLYFLKNKDIIEGSDKVTVEIRDKVTGLVINRMEMKERADYQIDYSNGRIVFWKPLPRLVESYSIISTDLMAGNLVYLLVDYEYSVEDEIDEANIGGRVRQAITDHIILGGTYIKEKLQTADYELKGLDVTVHVGPDSKITAEYAESKSEAQGSFISTDGGLSFIELDTDLLSSGKAYGISHESKFFTTLGITSYYKHIERGFSTSATSSQQGKELLGLGVVYDFSEDTRLTAKHDIQRLLSGGNEQTQYQVGAQETETTVIQLVHDLGKLRFTSEYRMQRVKQKNEQFESETNSQQDIFAVKAEYDINEKLTVSLEEQLDLNDSSKNQTTAGITYMPSDTLTLQAKESIGQQGSATELSVTKDMSEKLSLTGAYGIAKDKSGNVNSYGSLGSSIQVNENFNLHSNIGIEENTESGSITSYVIGGDTNIDDNTSLSSEFLMAESEADESTTISFGGISKVDDKTQRETKVSMTDSSVAGKSTSFSFGTKSKISDVLELASIKTFGESEDEKTSEDSYSLIREKDGRTLEGTLGRKYTDGKEEKSRSNIFGLSGDVNDKLAFTGTYERGEVMAFDGSISDRNVISIGAGYVDKNEETGKSLKASSKIETVIDEGNENRQQYLVYNSLEGKVTNELSVFGKTEYSKTRNTTKDVTEEHHKEFMFGAAFRPVNHDRFNFVGKYTYLENRSPDSQEDAQDILEERSHVVSQDVIYDINPYWQLVEKFAYRISEEKVSGFDFTKTHTWLMIHRLNYNIDVDWTIGTEFRVLSQQEAKDVRRGLLLEATRRLGEFAQLGAGYNFTEFNDDLTDLDYTSQGPFVRLTGKFYDRTSAEILRAREKWIEEKINRWAWKIVEEELRKEDSYIVHELNLCFILADIANRYGLIEDAREIYKDVVVAARMMHEEAAEYIRKCIDKEKNFKLRKSLADQYVSNGQYEEAKKILQKILEEVQQYMVE